MNSAFTWHPLSRKKRSKIFRAALISTKSLWASLLPALGHAASRLPDHQLRSDLAMSGGHFAFFQHRVNALDHNSNSGRAHGLHGLAHSSERRRVQSRRGHVVESDHRALFGHAD